MATDIYLIRHGEAFSNVDGTMGGEKGDKGLTERGLAQAQALATRLQGNPMRAHVLYASTLRRAQQTAEAVSATTGLPIIFDDDLQEIRPGPAVDGLHIDEALKISPQLNRMLDDLFTPIAPGGESWGAFQLRVSTVLERLVAAHQGQKVMIVAHGGVIEVASMFFLGQGPHQRTRNSFHVRNTAITHWRHDRSFGALEWQLIRHNDDRHLTEEWYD